MTAPADPRLPGGGGYVVSDPYDVNNNRFGQSNVLATLDSMSVVSHALRPRAARSEQRVMNTVFDESRKTT